MCSNRIVWNGFVAMFGIERHLICIFLHRKEEDLREVLTSRRCQDFVLEAIPAYAHMCSIHGEMELIVM